MKTIALTTTKQAEYVIQPHAVSRSIYRMSATARKIIAMAMACIPPDFSRRTAEFAVSDFYEDLDLHDGGTQRTILKAAVAECVGSVITLETPPRGWEMFTWITYAKYDDSANRISIEFSEKLADYLLELKKMYARIELADLGKLQSFYALRIFEIAKSYESLAGKEGNKKGKWFFTRTLPEIRHIMGIEPDEYPLTSDLRRFVLEAPVSELNNAGIGLSVSLSYIREGRCLAAVRFDCAAVAAKRPRKKPAAKKPAAADEDAELARLRQQYPTEYAALLESELANPPAKLAAFYGANPDFARTAAGVAASRKLRDQLAAAKPAPKKRRTKAPQEPV
jgi:hypothetical protein